MEHLLQWSRQLALRLMITGLDGEPRSVPIRPLPGEMWVLCEQRRLAVPLRNRRLALGLSQEELGRFVGVSRDSIQRWELARVPPRPMALIVWAQKLAYSIDLQPGARTTSA